MFHIPLTFARWTIKNMRNMHAVSTNQIADILHFNDNSNNENNHRNKNKGQEKKTKKNRKRTKTK